MTITDNEVKKILKRVRLYEVEESLESYPENERDGRCDMQMLADEASYILSLYTEGDTIHSDDLAWAREVLRETNHGKFIPLRLSTLKPKYRPSDIDNAKNTVNEYARLQRLVKRLEAKGYYGRW